MNDNTKQTVLQMIENLPDDVSYEDIMYHLYVLEAIEKGLEDIAEGRVVSHAEVERDVQKWLKSSGQ